jgi:hypothetical protein
MVRHRVLLWSAGPISASYDAARQFFAHEDRKNYTMREKRDIGYVNMPHNKEFYQVHSNALCHGVDGCTTATHFPRLGVHVETCR